MPKYVPIQASFSSQRQVVRIIILHILTDPQYNSTTPNISLHSAIHALCHLKTYLPITPAFAQISATPNHNALPFAPATTYFNTHTVTPPANPPAMAANPMNNTTLAVQACPSAPPKPPPGEKVSEVRRLLSMELMTRRPSREKMAGIQSVMVTWKWEPLRGEAE